MGARDAAEAWLARLERLAARLDTPSSAAWSLYCRAEVLGDTDPERSVGLARQAVRLDAVRTRLEDRMPPDAFDAARREGSAFTHRQTASFALAALEELRRGVRSS